MATPGDARYPQPITDLRTQLIAALPREPRRRSLRWLVRGMVAGPLLVALGCVLMPALAAAQTPGISVDLGTDAGGASSTLQLLALLTVLSLAPSIVIMMTSFTRIIIVLSFIRNAIGTPSIPPNQVLVGVALFLTMFVMGPTFTQINDRALTPLVENRIDERTAIARAEAPIRTFMFDQMTDDSSEISLFMEMSGDERPETRADVPTRVLIPAFVLSELKKAFEIGFLIFIPFLIIDIVIASTVMSMGMVMLPPVVISLPFKILLFVLVDGWSLVAESLLRGFNLG